MVQDRIRPLVPRVGGVGEPAYPEGRNRLNAAPHPLFHETLGCFARVCLFLCSFGSSARLMTGVRVMCIVVH